MKQTVLAVMICACVGLMAIVRAVATAGASSESKRQHLCWGRTHCHRRIFSSFPASRKAMLDIPIRFRCSYCRSKFLLTVAINTAYE